MSNYDNPEQWVTVTEAADRFKVSRSTIYAQIDAGRVQRVRLPGRQRPVRLAVADLLEAFSAVEG